MDSQNTKVVVVEGKDGYGNDCTYLGQQNVLRAVQDTDRDVKDAEANVRYGIKDSEADIRYNIGDSRYEAAKGFADTRHDVLFEGQEIQKTSLEVEARLKDRMTMDRNAIDAQFLGVNNRLCDLDKEVIKSGYEARLEALKTAERTNDKIAHALEEIREDLCECCKDQAVTAATQTGLLNTIISAVVK